MVTCAFDKLLASLNLGEVLSTSTYRSEESLTPGDKPATAPTQGLGKRTASAAESGRSRQWFLYRSCEVVWHSFRWLLKALPAELFQRMATPAIRAIIFFAVPKRRIVKVLDAAFGQSYATATKRGLARGIQQHFTASVVDCLLQLRHPNRLRANLQIEGREHLDAALAQGNGVIALSFHMGNFLLVGASLTLEGYRTHSLFRFFGDARIMALVHRDSGAFFSSLIPSLPRRHAVKQILEALKANETVVILADNLKRGEIETTLFDQPIRSARGPISLALRSGAAVLPMYLIRDYGGGLKLVIEPEMELARTENLNSDIAINTRRVIHHLENLIRRYPDQWHWLTVKMRPVKRQPDTPRQLDTPQGNGRV